MWNDRHVQFSVDVHGAGATKRHAAAELRAGKTHNTGVSPSGSTLCVFPLTLMVSAMGSSPFYERCHTKGVTRTSAFPKLGPSSMPMKAAGAFSKTVGDILATADATIGDSGADSAQEGRVVIGGEFVIDVAAQGKTFAQHLTHGRGKEIWSGGGSVAL
jgi:hypothetical protein